MLHGRHAGRKWTQARAGASHPSMAEPATATALRDTALTLAIGALGAGVAYALSFPAAMLIGPALAVSLAGLRGVRVAIWTPLRDACFILLGIAVGAGFTAGAGNAILRWPLAFATLALMLAATLWLGSRILHRHFGFDRRGAILAAAPGHLSFVLGIAQQEGDDIARIAVVQTIRLLVLTVTVPFVALALGYRMEGGLLSSGTAMAWPHLLALVVLGLGAGLVLDRARLPAPMLLGPLAISAAGQVSGLSPGSLPESLSVPAFLVLGALIGTRFSGLSPRALARALLAGLVTTAIAAVLTVLAAVPVALFLSMPVAHVVTAFAPGGLETMLALGATIGASPEFVVASHVMRLMILSVFIPLALGRRR
jgi:membrane AbrB-like protein